MSKLVLAATAAMAIGFGAQAVAQAPYETPEGRQCIQTWVTTTESRLNGYSGDAEFNARKPWQINQYGLFVGRKIKSNFEPDNWAQFGASRDSWMWLTYTSTLAYPDWNNVNFNRARVPGLRDFVADCLGGTQAGGTTAGTGPGPATVAGGSISPGDSCPASLSILSGYPGVVLGCFCDAGAMGGTVWGAQPYTADSSLCGAAQHAGAIPASGGAVWARVTPGLDAYSGTARNGITSADYGSYGTSMTILNGSPGSVTAQIAACPTNMSGRTEPLTCFCSADRIASPGRVWGTGTYTDDSNLCGAARHAGVVNSTGGSVSAVPVADIGGYTGSSRNGVTSNDYGAWRGAFNFD